MWMKCYIIIEYKRDGRKEEKMDIITLIENNSDQENRYESEHGLSFYIKRGDRKILFDTGKTGALIQNAEKMQVDLEKIDDIVMSHGHYDHTGGVRAYLAKYNNRPRFIVGDDFFRHGDKYRRYEDRMNRFIGSDFDEAFIRGSGVSLLFIDKKMVQLDQGIYIFSDFTQYEENSMSDTSLIYLNQQKEEIIDAFTDEIALGLDTKEGLVILVGCSHPGIINMIKSIQMVSKKQIYTVIGGSHLRGASEKRMKEILIFLQKSGIQHLGFNHCTGEAVIDFFEANFSGFERNITGKLVEIKGLIE